MKAVIKDFLTQHQDLSDYVQKTDCANANYAGIVNVNESYGFGIDSSNRLNISKPTSEQVKAGIANYRPIVPSVQDEKEGGEKCESCD